MALDRIVPLETREGHKYLIKFNSFNLDVLPDGITVPIIDITIEKVNDLAETNNAGTLFQIAAIIKDYAIENNVILYCYCDTAPIAKRSREILNQEFRSLLFIKMFEKQANDEYLNEQIIINDPANGDHYIHLFSKIHNKPSIELIASELQRFDK